MNPLKFGLLIATLLLVFENSQAQTSQLLNANEFEKKLSTTKEKVILDVRTPEEFKQGHLANAVNIDFYSSGFKQSVNKLDKNKPVFVYCLAGGRSGSAADLLNELGFKQVIDLQGGMKSWLGSNKPVVK